MFKNNFIKNGFLLIVASFMYSCDRSVGNNVKEKERSYVNKQLLRISSSVGPSSLDPVKVFDAPTANNIMAQIFEGLVKYDENNKLVPSLAESWDMSADCKKYTFYLRKDVKFHSGNPLTAQDVKFSYERACDKKFASPMADSFLIDIIGAREMLDGESDYLPGVVVKDNHTLEINLRRSSPSFVMKLWTPVTAIVDSKVCSRNEPINSLDKMVGTGPFKPVEFVPEAFFKMSKNDNYYGGNVKLNEILISIVKDVEMARIKFDNGSFAYRTVPIKDVPAVKNNPEYRDILDAYHKCTTWYLDIIQDGYKPFKDVRVRRAICMAVNRDYLVNGLYPNCDVLLSNGFLPYAELNLNRKKSPALLPYNPQKARELLEEAGYGKDNPLPSLTLCASESAPFASKIIENVCLELRKNLGVDAKMIPVSASMYTEAKMNSKYGIFFSGWVADYLDPNNFLRDLYHSKIGVYRKDYNNPVFDELVDRAESIKDTDERLKLFYRAEDMLISDAVIMPLCKLPEHVLVRPYLKGMKHNAMNTLPFSDVYLELSK